MIPRDRLNSSHASNRTQGPWGDDFSRAESSCRRAALFNKDEDYAAFERVMAYVLAETPVGLLAYCLMPNKIVGAAPFLQPVGLLAYCLMPNHWHFLLRPEGDHDLARFMQRLTITHTRRWKEHYHEVGHGHLYQGRFNGTLHPARWNTLFLALLATIIVLGTSTLGAVMIVAMLFLPAAAVLPWTRRIPQAIALSISIAILFLAIGFVASVEMGWPLSQSVGGVGCTTVLLGYVLGTLISTSQRVVKFRR